jgi:D-arabinose 5-phosphate isomerase GutQ
MSYAEQHLREAIQILEKLDPSAIEKMADLLAKVRSSQGRLFFLGVGGSAGNCLLNVFQADSIGCQVITVTNDILKKLVLVDKDLREYSLETVKMFYDDARAAGYKL